MSIIFFLDYFVMSVAIWSDDVNLRGFYFIRPLVSSFPAPWKFPFLLKGSVNRDVLRRVLFHSVSGGRITQTHAHTHPPRRALSPAWLESSYAFLTERLTKNPLISGWGERDSETSGYCRELGRERTWIGSCGFQSDALGEDLPSCCGVEHVGPWKEGTWRVRWRGFWERGAHCHLGTPEQTSRRTSPVPVSAAAWSVTWSMTWGTCGVCASRFHKDAEEHEASSWYHCVCECVCKNMCLWACICIYVNT